MQTINDFLNYRDKCPCCGSYLSLFLHGQYGSSILEKDHSIFHFTRVARNAISFGGGTKYVIYCTLLEDNSFYINFAKDIYSDVLEAIPLDTINHFKDLELKRLPSYMISNGCNHCDYEYSARFSFNYKLSTFTISEFANEIFCVNYNDPTSYYVVNNFASSSSEVLLITDNRDHIIYPLRHWLIRYSSSFSSIPVNRQRLTVPTIYDPTEEKKNEEEFRTLFLFS